MDLVASLQGSTVAVLGVCMLGVVAVVGGRGLVCSLLVCLRGKGVRNVELMLPEKGAATTGRARTCAASSGLPLASRAHAGAAGYARAGICPSAAAAASASPCPAGAVHRRLSGLAPVPPAPVQPLQHRQRAPNRRGLAAPVPPAPVQPLQDHRRVPNRRLPLHPPGKRLLPKRRNRLRNRCHRRRCREPLPPRRPWFRL